MSVHSCAPVCVKRDVAGTSSLIPVFSAPCPNPHSRLTLHYCKGLFPHTPVNMCWIKHKVPTEQPPTLCAVTWNHTFQICCWLFWERLPTVNFQTFFFLTTSFKFLVIFKLLLVILSLSGHYHTNSTLLLLYFINWICTVAWQLHPYTHLKPADYTDPHQCGNGSCCGSQRSEWSLDYSKATKGMGDGCRLQTLMTENTEQCEVFSHSFKFSVTFQEFRS